ncbi:UNVERIFIED_CONTAM: hypothetical protein K2H54_029729 [Gekko kuhli]
MLLVCQFQLLILIVFLLACTFHMMVDLLPNLERRVAAGAKVDFSSKPSSNLSSCSAEKGTAAVAELGVDGPGSHKALIPNAGGGGNNGGGGLAGKRTQVGQQPLGGGGSSSGGGLQQLRVGHQGSRLVVLFQQPLYQLAATPLGNQGVLFNVNSDIHFIPKVVENQDW